MVCLYFHGARRSTYSSGRLAEPCQRDVACMYLDGRPIPEGKAVDKLRKQTVEPVFGQVKGARGFRQFPRRGPAAVSAEWSLLCTAHNLLKLHQAVVRPVTASPGRAPRRYRLPTPLTPKPAASPLRARPRSVYSRLLRQAPGFGVAVRSVRGGIASG